MAEAAEVGEEPRRTRRALLAQYYKEEEGQLPASSSSRHPMDMDGSAFDAETYSQRLIKEASLSQLMAHESEVVRQIGALDSDMQTLVYENYNKFIAATDTIRKMRVDFRAMEDEMDRLADKMQNISVFSGQITAALQDRRQRIGQLSSTHALLKKLQFLFELPNRLKECMDGSDGEDEHQQLATGVRYYLRAQRVLDQYKHMASFRGIKADCDQIMVKLREKLFARLRDPETAPEDISLYVDLLLDLKEAPEELCDIYLSTARMRLTESLDFLEDQINMFSGQGIPMTEAERPSDAYKAPLDVLGFVDHGCNAFVSDLCLVIASYSDTFINKKRQEHPLDEKMANEKLVTFVEDLNNVFMSHLRARLRLERQLEDTALRVRALDRFHRRTQAMSRLLPTVDFSRASLDLVLEAAEMHCALALTELKRGLDDSLMAARQVLVAPRRLSSDGDGDIDLAELNSKLLKALVDNVKTQLATLRFFVDPELTFAVKTYFRAKFGRFYVREGVLVAFLAHLIETAQVFCGGGSSDGAKSPPPPLLLLLLSRCCYDMQKASSSTQYLLALADEQFFIDDSSGLTSAAKVNDLLRHVSQMLLDAYVKCQGGLLSQMLSKSVAARDWLNAVEPRTVRAVMKRVVEETTTIDRQVGGLYEEGARKARSSDSSRRMAVPGRGGGRSTTASGWSAQISHHHSSQLDTSLASNIQKMFNERIEIFSPVEFSRVSVLTGIVKIALKTLLECVRTRTFSRYGFQQIQVDVHYLQLYLWRFVSDENLVTFLLDEVMTSAVRRCADPVPMEGSVVEMICDRG